MCTVRVTTCKYYAESSPNPNQVSDAKNLCPGEQADPLRWLLRRLDKARNCTTPEAAMLEPA